MPLDYSKWDAVGVSSPRKSSEPAELGTMRDSGSGADREKLPKAVAKAAARSVMLRGATDVKEQAWMGVYTLQSGVETNGRLTYLRAADRETDDDEDDEDDEDDSPSPTVPVRALWASPSGRHWQLGYQANLGTSRCHMHVHDSALLPDDVSATWVRCRGREWIEDATIECVGLALALAELGASADVVHLFGVDFCVAGLSQVGVFDRRDDVVNGFPAYVQRQSARESLLQEAEHDDERGAKTAMLWWASGAWHVGPEEQLGRNHVAPWQAASDALLPDRISSGWRQLVNGNWVSRPRLRCLSDAALASEFETASREIHLVGNTPDGAQASRLGAYRMRDSLVNGFPAYESVDDPDALLWRSKNQIWVAGPRVSLGTCMGFFHTDTDGAIILPEHAGSNGDWSLAIRANGSVHAPHLRCVSKATLEAASRTVYAVGNPPKDAQRARIGAYRLNEERINGLPAFSMIGTSANEMLWWAAGSWRIGSGKYAGSSTCGISAKDSALLPELCTKWECYDAKSKTWSPSPEVRCLSEAAFDLETEVGSRTIYLVGSTPNGNQVDRLGAYTQEEERVNGFPAYAEVTEGVSQKLWWSAGKWRVGYSQDLGRASSGLRTINGSALLPELCTKWECYDAKSKTWSPAPEVRCLSDAAFDLEIEAASRTIYLVGSTPDGGHYSEALLGVYLQQEERVRGFPAYAKRDVEGLEGQGRRLWSTRGRWRGGNAMNFGTTQCTLTTCNGFALLPELCTKWQVWAGKAWSPGPELRCLSEAAFELEISARSRVVYLVGHTPNHVQNGRLGAYVQKEGRVNGFTVYAMQETDGVQGQMLWWKNGSWFVGSSTGNEDVYGIRTINDGALLPELCTKWECYDGERMAWLPAPELRCLSEAAFESEVAARSNVVHLVGALPGAWAPTQGVLRCAYLQQAERVHGFPTYGIQAMEGVQDDHDEMLWWMSGRWFVSPRKVVGKGYGIRSISDGALLPELCTEWEVFDGESETFLSAPELRCLSEAAFKSEEEARRAVEARVAQEAAEAAQCERERLIEKRRIEAVEAARRAREEAAAEEEARRQAKREAKQQAKRAAAEEKAQAEAAEKARKAAEKAAERERARKRADRSHARAGAPIPVRLRAPCTTDTAAPRSCLQARKRRWRARRRSFSAPRSRRRSSGRRRWSATRRRSGCARRGRRPPSSCRGARAG